MQRLHLSVILADSRVPSTLREALLRIDATVSFVAVDCALNASLTKSDAFVVVLPESTGGVVDAVTTLLHRIAHQPRGTLLLHAAGAEPTQIPHPPIVPVIHADGADGPALAVQIGSLLAMRSSLDLLHRRAVAARRSNDGAAHRYTQQLRLASQVQRELIPRQLPHFGRFAFDAVFRPVDYVSGDIYDVHRLDEDHIAIALADATGHGIPAALMTVYIKRALRGKEIEHGEYRILPPDEVLQRLNDDLLDAALSECPFVAAVYAVLNTATLELKLARGGGPYPIIRSADGDTRVIQSTGGVVGVLPAAKFEVATIQLRPGDDVVLYSDGLERIVAPELAGNDVPEPLRKTAERVAGYRRLVRGMQPRAANAVAVPAGSRPAARRADAAPQLAAVSHAPHGLPQDDRRELDLVLGSTWFSTLREEGVSAAMAAIEDRRRRLRRIGFPLDDLTVVTLHVGE